MSEQGPSSGVPRAASAARVTVLVDEVQAVPELFVAGLRRRGAVTFVVHGAPAAMAQLAAERCQVLVVVEPSRIRRLEPLLRAVRTCYPHVSCWRYEREKHPSSQLTRFDTVATADLKPLEGGRPAEAEANQPDQANAASADKSRAAPSTTDDSNSSITADELAMLMGPLDDLTDANGEDIGGEKS